MLTVGLLGSDSSHADRIAKLLNLAEHPSHYADARSTALGRSKSFSVTLDNGNYYHAGLAKIPALLRGESKSRLTVSHDRSHSNWCDHRT